MSFASYGCWGSSLRHTTCAAVITHSGEIKKPVPFRSAPGTRTRQIARRCSSETVTRTHSTLPRSGGVRSSRKLAGDDRASSRSIVRLAEAKDRGSHNCGPSKPVATSRDGGLMRAHLVVVWLLGVVLPGVPTAAAQQPPPQQPPPQQPPPPQPNPAQPATQPALIEPLSLTSYQLQTV